MSLFISGTCATIFFSSEAYPTRISVGFAHNLKRQSQPSGSQVPLSVTAATSKGAFTAVVDALVDPLCEEDVVLGKDWIDLCALNNILPLTELPPVYSSGESVNVTQRLGPPSYLDFAAALSPFLLPERFAPPLGSSPPFFTISYSYTFLLDYVHIVVGFSALRTCSTCAT
jgi:hypothetical protein